MTQCWVGFTKEIAFMSDRVRIYREHVERPIAEDKLEVLLRGQYGDYFSCCVARINGRNGIRLNRNDCREGDIYSLRFVIGR